MVEFLLNGEPVRAEPPYPQYTLLDFLRDRGLTGAKEGCAEGECGACTVVLVADDRGRTAYRPVNACLLFLPMAAGHEIRTVEGLACEGRLADAQQAMAAAGGSQCGYCTPGFVMSLFAEQYRPDRVGSCDTEALAGNLCRCTGYRPIRDAAHSLGPAPDDSLRGRLALAAPVLEAVETEGFSRPATVAAALAVLARDPAAVVVSGATDLGVEANIRARRWPLVVSLEAIDDLRAFTETPSLVRIGAALPLSDIGRRWTSAPPVIQEWLTLFASPTIRNRATLGGNLATASPIGDAAPMLLAMNAVGEIASGGSAPWNPPYTTRRVPLADFFLDYRRTQLQPGELITAVEIPKPWPQTVRFYKVAKRRADDISTVAAGLSIARAADGRITAARFAFGGVAATPLRVTDAETAAVGQPWTEATVERINAVIARTLTPLSDHRGSAAYRLQVAQRLVEKFWWETRA